MATYKKDINLLAAMTKKKSRVSPLALIVPILVFVLLGAGIAVSTVYITSQTTELSLKRDDLQSYLDSPRVLDGQRQVASLKSEAERLQSLASQVRGTLYNLSSYPDLAGKDFQYIFELAGEDIELTHFSYDRRTGALHFSATCQSVRKIPIFVQSLRTCGIFSDVQYQGYVSETESVIGSPILDPVTDITTLSTYEIQEYRYEISCLVAYPVPTLPDVTGSSDDGGDNAEGGGE
jgi:hypothetical protein